MSCRNKHEILRFYRVNDWIVNGMIRWNPSFQFRIVHTLNLSLNNKHHVTIDILQSFKLINRYRNDIERFLQLVSQTIKSPPQILIIIYTFWFIQNADVVFERSIEYISTSFDKLNFKSKLKIKKLPSSEIYALMMQQSLLPRSNSFCTFFLLFCSKMMFCKWKCINRKMWQ